MNHSFRTVAKTACTFCSMIHTHTHPLSHERGRTDTHYPEVWGTSAAHGPNAISRGSYRLTIFS